MVLFLGCSLLSFVELFYFAIIGFITKVKQRSQVIDISGQNCNNESLSQDIKSLKENVSRIQASFIDLQKRLELVEKNEIRVLHRFEPSKG